MAKKVKMVLYGEPGVGKSTFAGNAPSPFFVCTDGNYEWLDRPEEDHAEVSSWEQAKTLFGKLGTSEYDKYQTIVVDLTEDLFKWCEQEFCKRSKLEHIGDLGFGKGYDITRNEFFIEIGKLINLPKNIILLMHGLSTVVKDRRGVEHTKHIPSTRIPDKVLDMIEGRVRYFIRCYVKAEENEDGALIKKRYLSIVPKENEFGISRGIDEATTPHDIELDWNVFATTIGLDNEPIAKVVEKVETKPEPKKTTTSKKVEPKKEEPKEEVKVVEEITKAEEKPFVEEIPSSKIKELDEVEEKVVVKEEPKKVEPKKEEVKVEEPKKEEQPKTSTQMTMAERIAAIKAKAAEMKNKNN